MTKQEEQRLENLRANTADLAYGVKRPVLSSKDSVK
jgi:hypothetical protein